MKINNVGKVSLNIINLYSNHY